jgi:putative intracellular protease/amidase
VISGPPPVQILDVTGPLEVFSNAPGYSVEVAAPDGSRALETDRRIALSGAIPIQDIRGPIDTLVIAGGPGAESGVYDKGGMATIRHKQGPYRHNEFKPNEL